MFPRSWGGGGAGSSLCNQVGGLSLRWISVDASCLACCEFNITTAQNPQKTLRLLCLEYKIQNKIKQLRSNIASERTWARNYRSILWHQNKPNLASEMGLYFLWFDPEKVGRIFSTINEGFRRFSDRHEILSSECTDYEGTLWRCLV